MRKLLEWVSLVLLLVFGLIILFRTPVDASNLEIVPDSIEYAYGASNLANGDGYHIRVGGRNLPPRYPPWFSATLVLAYWLWGDQPGNGILIVLGFALVGLGAAYRLGSRVSGPWGGVAAGILLLVVTEYHYWGRQIMTDVPTSALILVLAGMWLSLVESPRRLQWGIAGVVVAYAAALRITAAAFLLPFLVLWWHRRPRRLSILMGLVAPLLVLGCFSAIYNRITFGSFGRSGYSYWGAIPYDYRTLLYSLHYVPENLRMLWRSGLLGLLGAGVLGWSILGDKARTLPIRAIYAYALLGGAPIVLFHLIYFYPDDRFYLPLCAVMAVACGGLLGIPARRWSMGLLVAGQIALVAAGIWATMHLRRDSNLERWKTAEAILKHTPPDAVIVTGLPPAYLENYPGMKHRSIIPLSRNVEYASKVLVMSKIHDLSVQPAGWWDTRSPELIASGAEEVIPWVALDHPDRLVNFLMEGRRVYVDRETVPQWHVDGIARSLNLLLRDNGKKLFELSLPAE